MLKKSVESLHQALRIFEQTGDEILQGLCYEYIANDTYDTHTQTEANFRKAIQLYQKALAIYQKKDEWVSLSTCHSNMGLKYQTHGDYQQAAVHYKEAHKVAVAHQAQFTHIQHFSLAAVALTNLGFLYLDGFKKYDSVHYFARRAIPDLIKYEKRSTLSRNYLNMGFASVHLKRYAEAKTYLDSSMYIARQIGDNEGIMMGWEGYHALDSATGNAWKALHDYKRFTRVKDSLFNIEKVASINNLNVQYETEKREQAIANLQEQNRKQQLINWIVVGLGMAAVGLVVFLVRAFRLQKKLNRSQQQVAEQEKQLEVERNLRLQAEVEAKQRELLSARVFIQQKNELLENLQDQLQEVTVGATANQEPLRQMSRSIRQNIRFDDDWERIKLHFEGVHPGFFQQLKQTGPTLSDHELRHCAYIKMKFSTKEIANLLSIDANSVKVSRYRIRKKLNLPAETDLPDYLATL